LRSLRELFFQQEAQRDKGTKAQSELPNAGKLFLFTKTGMEKTQAPPAGFAFFA